MKTIRVNDELSHILEKVPKNLSHSNFILLKLRRLTCHEKFTKFWVVENKEFMYSYSENGTRKKVKLHKADVWDTIPITNELVEKEEGWLQRNEQEESFAHGGFINLKAAESYIYDYLGGFKYLEEIPLSEIDYEGDLPNEPEPEYYLPQDPEFKKLFPLRLTIKDKKNINLHPF